MFTKCQAFHVNELCEEQVHEVRKPNDKISCGPLYTIRVFMGNETARDMETESVKSENSSRSRRSRGHRSNYRQHSHRSTRSNKSRKNDDMAPFQTAVTLTPENREGQEIIEVQILPQDDNWGENTTAITGNTSEQSESTEDVSNWPGEPDTGLNFICQRYVGTILTYVLSTAAFLSPLAMVILPKIGFFPALSTNLGLQNSVKLLVCGAECKGQLVSLAFKLIILAVGAWAVFLRKPNATLPRIFLFRAAILVFVLVCTFAYWLFYIVQVTETARAAITPEESVDYKALVAYASSLTDTLLFIHYLAVVLVEIRHIKPVYYIKIVRSPDGESKAYAIGQLSIQRAAVWVLEKYYTEFPIYNPYLERIPVSKSRKASTSFKFYEVDGVNNTSMQQSQSRAMLAAHARRRDSSHNERFYEEHEYERRVKKRRARLITAAEEAFTHIKRLHNDQVPAIPMDPHEAAQAIFPSMARALQKYLRVTRQQPRHSVESILIHLANCLSNDLTPRAFLEPYLVTEPVLQNDKEQRDVQTWALICEELLSRPIGDNVTFHLRQNDVSLICTIKKLPHFNVTEEVVDPKSNKFVLRLNSETSV
ncbi:vang-like protein [Holotrichia oblita]|uniref:Vang-like protein n=2 Tax=Holotrichia oblita TaxID=644536 RepID=A0ACB9SUT3_HOLOL|nr:vang-like protein [Holotrichia oblita]KAI4458256.1 vang-like protein [Holotrichia oblita]